MSKLSERAAAALEQLPDFAQERVVTLLMAEVKRYEELKREIQLGIDDIEAGRTVPWDLEGFLKRAREAANSYD